MSAAEWALYDSRVLTAKSFASKTAHSMACEKSYGDVLAADPNRPDGGFFAKSANPISCQQSWAASKPAKFTGHSSRDP